MDEAHRYLRGASGRFASARETQDGERAARLRAEGEEYLADLEALGERWPWQPWASVVREHEVVLDKLGAPLWEGLHVTRRVRPHANGIEHTAFGRVLHWTHGVVIAMRRPAEPGWTLLPVAEAALNFTPENYPGPDSPPWPDDIATTERAIERRLGGLRSWDKWEALGWGAAPDDFLLRWWPRFHGQIAAWLAKVDDANEHYPVQVNGRLVVGQRAEVLLGTLIPPTFAGWREYLRLAPASGLTFSALKDVGRSWWQRQIPANLLAASLERLVRDVVAPRVSQSPAVVAALAQDPESARAEHDKVLDFVMSKLGEAHADTWTRYTSEPGFAPVSPSCPSRQSARASSPAPGGSAAGVTMSPTPLHDALLRPLPVGLA
ncbi:hypothetical protein [Nannocystis pusilla]|uniref:hypothetical protein n=1 Tax=Nannocystis pusilla TaxID=889268 RepID=UPI003B81928A